MGRWSTASYFNQLKYEQLRYSQILNAQLQAYLNIRVHYLLSDVSKGLALEFGRVGACLLAASLIINGDLSVGEMSALLAYWVQFTSKLGRCPNLFLECFLLRDRFCLLDNEYTAPFTL